MALDNVNITVVTEDGAHSLISGKFGVAYHSLHGAMVETNTVFIDMGLQYKLSQGMNLINIFEMGFGTGLNALCTIDKVANTDIHINYTTVEAYPINQDELDKLNYLDLFGLQYKDAFYAMHHAESGDVINIENFSFKKYLGVVEDWVPDSKFDIIYYDAFSPTTQPELWEVPIMRKMFDILEPGGILCTYCAKGVFKRVLKEVGFTLESMPGPGRKREITRAIKPNL